MAVDLHFEESLLRQLKLKDPWLPPKSWESVPSESGASDAPSSSHASFNGSLYDLSSVSEASLVRLALNALQGVQSAVVSIEKLSAMFCADPADRSAHRIPTLWNRSLSTCALGKMLKSIGFSGSLVILLREFVDYFTNSTLAGGMLEMGRGKPGHEGENMNGGNDMESSSQSLVNQAFAVAVRTVLEGYLCALDTLNASVNLRRTSNDKKMPSDASQQGSLTSISHSKVTLLETYLHTKELRTQIEALGHLCHLSDSALHFSVSSFEDVVAKACAEIPNFPRGGNLLTYLYRELQVVDPAHCSLLKFLFLRSLEPYCRFIRSWIYEAKIIDPYDEFVVEYSADPRPYSHGKAGIPADFPLASVREQDGVSIPCFLRDVLAPLLRAGQQLQMVMKLLRLCNYVHAGEDTFEDILPGSSDFCITEISGSPLSFNKAEIEAIVLSRKNFYCKMYEKLDKFMDTLDIKYRQVVLYDAAYGYTSYSGANMDAQYISDLYETLEFPSAAAKRDLDRASENSSVEEEFSYVLEPSDCSSTDGSDEQADAAQTFHLHDNLAESKPNYLSSLCFSRLSPAKASEEVSLVEHPSYVLNDSVYPRSEEFNIRKYDTSCTELVELSRPWMSENKYSVEMPLMGWPVGGLRRNPLRVDQRYNDDRNLQNSGIDECKIMPGISRQSIPEGTMMHNVCQPLGYEFSSSSSYLIQSWNARFSSNILSMNPMLTKNAFILDVDKPKENSSKISKSFPCFDFLSATNPLKVYEERSSADPRYHIGYKPFPSLDTKTSSVGNVDGCGRTQKVEDVQLSKDDLGHSNASMNLEDISEDSEVHLKNACGGSSWQVLLRGSLRVSDDSVRKHGHKKEPIFEMPLDFIIDKGLVQEIMLQYMYVSRLSIKLLERGFDLQEHFHALRRYHYMEIADWADLFITSLWHHKWYFTEADQKIPEIQGLLESSIQRSSCERDHCKDRLFVYVKNLNKTPFSSAALGLHSFDFIGLGYRVDWPVTIVLTPDALRIYADIFSYLIQLKLAVLSLSDVWCSLKGFKHLISDASEQHQLARTKFNCIVNLRHQVNHFVSTLQQYVLSQLSDVSWCRFCFSLKHEVKDMMDLESVHMAYLKDSLRICFLSDETLSISHNIEKILQCALDFRSCLVKGLGDIGSDRQSLIHHMSQINVSQALSIKRKFDKNLKELHSSYLKSSKHGEFGLHRFWTCLNYNDYYADAFGNDMYH